MNMSYCMCENTAAALKQVLEAMEQTSTEKEFIEEMGRTELRGYHTLYTLCKMFVEEYSYKAETSESDPMDDFNYVGSKHHY